MTLSYQHTDLSTICVKLSLLSRDSLVEKDLTTKGKLLQMFSFCGSFKSVQLFTRHFINPVDICAH